MSTEKDVEQIGEGDLESNYQPPPQKSIEEIIAADQEDESLRKYKEALLGAAQSEKIVVGKCVCIFEWNKTLLKWCKKRKFLFKREKKTTQQLIILDSNDPRKVIVKRLALCVPDRADMELDLAGDLSKLKKQVN